METVNKYHHADKRQLEEQKHIGRFESGKKVLIGAKYKGILLRNGTSIDVQFTANVS